jgi:hypothetical protein
MRELGRRSPKRDGSSISSDALQTSAAQSFDDFFAEWNSPGLIAAREACREIPLDPYDEQWQRLRPSFMQLFHFLERLSEAVLDGRIDEVLSRQQFETAVRSIWNIAFTLLAPPNHADEWWDPPPKIALLSARWRTP